MNVKLLDGPGLEYYHSQIKSELDLKQNEADAVTMEQVNSAITTRLQEEVLSAFEKEY